MFRHIFLWFILIVNCAQSSITDKEYARLPPVFELDNFDRCMLLQDEALYCSVEFLLKPLDPNHPSSSWNRIKELSADPKNYLHDNLRHGICVPFTCPNISVNHDDPDFKDVLANCYSKKYEKDGLYGKIGYMHCQTNESVPMDFYDISVAIFFSIYIVFVVYASLYEGVARYKPKEDYERITSTIVGKIITSFSITKNWIRLKTVNRTPETETFRAFQGVRFYNVVMVLLCHACLLFTLGPIVNTKMVENLFDNPGTVFIASGPNIVGTFFLMSSWLLTYNIFMNFDEKSDRELDLKTLIQILLYRFIRLTPPLAVIIIFHSTLLYHVSTGPWWDHLIGRERVNCRKTGWMNLFYINNLISDSSEMCFLESWFTAVDMHGFILVLIILYFTVKRPQRLQWVIPSVWLVIHAIYLKRVYDLEIYTFILPHPEVLYQLNGLMYSNIWINTIAATSSNLGGTLIGVVAGYVSYKYKQDKIFTKKSHIVWWWFLSFGMGFSIIVLPGMWIFSKNYYSSMWFSLPYFALGTTIFVIAVAVGLFGASKGIGWMAKWCVEWTPMYVLGRLTYSPFLVHYAIMFVKAGASRHLTHMDNFSVFLVTIEVLSCSLLFGFIMTLTVELPVTALLALFLKENVKTITKKTGKSYYTEDNHKEKS